MSITNKVTVGLVSLAFVFSLFAVSSVTAATQDEQISALQAKINQLLEQIQGLESSQSSNSRTYSSSSSTGGNAACPYTWTRNLSIGSTGDDVRQLQRFLNGNPQTQVAVTGVGSPGNESSYYGPATARAVGKFQEMYAAQILTPLGLTKGTGGFYTSTRAQANEVCQKGSGSAISVNRAGTRSATSPAVVRVTGDALAVTPGNPISDSYVVLGAQRAPFTSVVLTAGSDDVRIESIRIKRFGLSSSDNFDSIALVDANGVQVGSARSLNSKDEVSLGSNFVVPANRSVTLAVIGNMTTDDSEFKSGAIAGLEVAEVIANARVQGTFPIRGAAHVLSSSIGLQKVDISVSGGGGDIEFNEDTEVASVSVELTTNTVGGESADAEDAYLRSIILEQVGSADLSELGDMMVYVDDERVDYSISVDRDRFVINFGGKGVMIEEGDDVEIVVETNTDTGYEETVQFAIDEASDVYILGASYGYGLPVCFDDDDNCDGSDGGSEGTWEDTEGKTKTAVATISSGSVAKGDRLKKFKDEVSYGNDVILGAYSVEFEGEDVMMEDLKFSVELDNYPYADASDNAWESAEEDTVSFDSVRLRVDGENIAYADDSIDFDEPGNGNGITLDVDFDGAFTIDVRDDREVIFEIVANLDSAWSHFDGATVEFTLTEVDTVEGVSSEKDYTDTGEHFASDLVFESVKLIGNEVEFAINGDGVDGTSFVTGADNVVFGTLEVDADDAIDDIELRDLYVSFQVPTANVGNLADLNNCRILDEGGDEIADSRSISGDKGSTGGSAVTDQARFRFDDYVVDAGDREDLDIVCDIDDGATAGDAYQLVAVATGSDPDSVKYRIGRDEDEEVLEAASSDLITIGTSGELTIATDNPDENEVAIAIATGSGGVDDVAVLEIELEAEKEDIEILDVYLSLPANMGATVGGSNVAVAAAALEEVYDRFTLEFGSVTADADDYEDNMTFAAADYANLGTDITGAKVIAFEDVNEIVQDGEDNTETFDLTVDFNGIDDNDGVAGQFVKGSSLIIVWEGDDSGTINLTQHAITGDAFTAALPFPTVPTVSTTAETYSLTGGTQKVYEFTVNADDEGDVYLGQVSFSVGDSSNLVTALSVYRGTSNDGSVRATTTSIAATTPLEFDAVEKIDAGQSRTYSVYATMGSPGDGDSVYVQLLHDGEPNAVAAGQEYGTGVGNFVWSPNALDKDGATTSNADWFNGWTVVKDSDTKEWKLRE